MSKLDLMEKIKEVGVKDIRYYYKNCELLGNIYTCCVLISEDKLILSRGVSICSVSDMHNKKDGRSKSKDRALKALFSKQNSEPISQKFEKTLTKVFKVKDMEQKERLIKIAESLNLKFKLRKLEKFEILDVYIPYSIKLKESRKEFEFKSEFLPKSTESEKRMFKLT